MVSAFDPRIINIGLDFGNGPVNLEGLSVQAIGRKYGSPTMNECQCRIYNLTKQQQNYILTQASPLKRERTPINMTLDVGRESYGTFRLFEGAVFQCGASQPPDIGIMLRSLTSNYQTGIIMGTSQPATALLSVIAANVAANNGLTLVFEATDKQIANFGFNGAVSKQVSRLGEAGGVDAFVDNDKLVVIDSQKYRKGATRVISAATGMVGVPQPTDSGVLVQMMIDNSIELGGSVEVQSELNPACNGTYKVVQINFEAANRDNPFWYTLVCSNLAYYQGN